MTGLIRVWKELDLQDIEKNLIVVGELSSECFACHKIGIDLHSIQCPGCGIYFKYVGFRRRVQAGYLKKLKDQHPQLLFIDFEDFKKSLGKRDARKLLDI
ncbi:MAG: hypothetical protein PHU64_00160 [Candidatus Omnitrophica bacterium]|nr:hypothetical protein [Candidatus Omnitrophota bacterium]MDD5430416.1 hypothetical protein [Candidatus Omnitrophota bacterium]